MKIYSKAFSEIGSCSGCHSQTSLTTNFSFSKSNQIIHLAFDLKSSFFACSSKQSENIDDILGPDVPPAKGWCEEVVCSTSDLMKILASKAPLSSRGPLFSAIGQLEEKCIQCCRSGAFWKTCVAPIVHKWQEWNKKWDIFRIPPDPAWD